VDADEHPGWAAVVVNHDAGPLLERCVRSVLADTSGGPVDVVVVDNASTDDSIAALGAAGLPVRVVPAGGNLGYARAANLGIAHTAAAVVAVLNPDTELEAGAAGVLLERFRTEPTLGAVGPRVDDPTGRHYPSARSVPAPTDAVGHALVGWVAPTNPWTRRYRQLDVDPDLGRDVAWVSGAAIWLRRRALDEVGGWDERYFMYVEDLDLCWRLGRRGWRVAYEPGARVVHVQGVSTARRPYRMLVEHHRSALRFASRRLTGWRRVLVPFAALFFAARAAFALGAYAVSARRSGRRGTG
jgi:N-acetylglucosaminyl-diphospho-decaprenol L-rhamnosyltransferase